MPSKYICNILNYKHFRFYSLNCIYKNGESISSIFNTFLVTKSAKWLTRRPTYYNTYFVNLFIIIPNG